MNLYNKAQLDYRDGCKARIRRQMEISKIILMLWAPLWYLYCNTPERILFCVVLLVVF